MSGCQTLCHEILCHGTLWREHFDVVDTLPWCYFVIWRVMGHFDVAPLWRGGHFDMGPLCPGGHFDLGTLCHIKGNETLWRGTTLTWCTLWHGTTLTWCTLWCDVHFDMVYTLAWWTLWLNGHFVICIRGNGTFSWVSFVGIYTNKGTQTKFALKFANKGNKSLVWYPHYIWKSTKYTNTKRIILPNVLKIVNI